MSYYGTSVEYGIHCLLHLVRAPQNAWLSSKDVADFQGISPSYVAKLFTRLQKNGILFSSEGVDGGFRLTRSASEISILDVIDALGGEKPLFQCREIRKNCVLHQGEPPGWVTHGVCDLHAAMLAAESKMREQLRKTTLESLVVSVARKAPAVFATETNDWFNDRRGRRRGVSPIPTS